MDYNTDTLPTDLSSLIDKGSPIVNIFVLGTLVQLH